MKLIFPGIFALIILAGCTQQPDNQRSYEQQNSASQKALQKLDQDTQ
jgi:uncharacterized lipoprotein YajG